MNYKTYALLRQVASDIRRPALDLSQTSIATEGVKKAVAFLVGEVYINGDVTLASRSQYAAELRAIADEIDNEQVIAVVPSEQLN
ncbi:hypothetical protein PO883_31695 [Massilia sp. DJPM01]|uniref:hypothetical protein n=1 Tax=Massilia sp. DJPM01 TaxID=3024404 RepID=UPI00259F8C8F|nr:hypothetical protein [Massilia sp. DJPM01]MDM5181746.1 hypothetical protein [Massilia sp. DJPM01]